VWSAWATELIAGDTWDGNLVSDGQRIVLLSREKIEGFWTGRPALALSLSTASEGALAAWATCRDVACSAIDLRVGDVAVGLADPTRIDLGARARPVGLALAGGSMVRASVREDPSGQAAARTLLVAAGPRP
jgi:hypothetical protein